MKLTVSCSALAVALALSPFSAWGQALPVAFEASDTVKTDVDDDNNQNRADDIIITGEKVSRRLQDTPTSVAVTSAQDIDDQNLRNFYDITQRTANVTSTFQNTGFTIRGISNTNVTGVGTGDLATVYLDGSPLPRTALSGPLDLWDVGSVEILRGPQSTLQGRNALAGAVIIRTTDPSFDWNGRARFIATTNTDELRFGAAVRGPIVADQIAFRIAAEHSRVGRLITNPTRDDKRAGRRDGDMIRGKLLITPSALPDLRIVLGYLHDWHVRGQNYSFIDVADPWKNRTTLGNRALADTTRSDIGTLDVGYDLGGGVAVSSVTTYARIVGRNRYDGDNLPVDLAYGGLNSDQRTWTEELRLTVNKGPVTGVFGGYYSWLDNKRDQAFSTFGLSPIDDLGLPATIAPFYPAILYIDTEQRYPQTVRNLALFGDATWEVAPRLKLRFGARYDNERQVRANNNIVTLKTPLPDPALFGALGPTVTTINGLIQAQVAAANAVSPAATTNFEAFLPKAGVTYDFTPDASLSATVQRGYRSGGSGVNPGRGSLYTYRPEYTWNYEVALRTQWLDRTLTINANAFYIDWKNQQVNVQLSGNIYDYQTINAGSSRVWGGELETRYQPSKAFGVYASAGYSNTRFTEFSTTVGTIDDLSGQQFPNAPRWTLTGGGTWQPAGGWFVNANVSYISTAYQQVCISTAALCRQIEPHTLASIKAGWQNDNFGIFATVTNLFNSKWSDYSYVNDTREQGLLGEPRVFGVVLEAKF